MYYVSALGWGEIFIKVFLYIPRLNSPISEKYLMEENRICKDILNS